jgi:hypothetical protein
LCRRSCRTNRSRRRGSRFWRRRRCRRRGSSWRSRNGRNRCRGLCGRHCCRRWNGSGWSNRHWRCRGSRRYGCRRRWRCRRPGACLGRGFLGLRLRLGLRLGCGVGLGSPRDVPANLYGHVFRDRARVRLLFRDSVARQKIDDGFGLHFQFAGQFVNTDLICFAQDFASSGCSESGSAVSDATSVAS